ncbi:MAG TPA: helix-turn-helix domain-containing protein [Candidatus Thermoplasmatota archaeon]|nr:helix-turn-helix domain-containing protein [Candidatus Thermoplasmatota archaeon]
MPHDPLELETRRTLYQFIVRHPGKYLRELQRELGMAMGALEHHLRELEAAGLVTVQNEEHKRFFSADLPRADKPILGQLRQALARRALVVLLTRGPCTKTALLDALGVSASTLNYHLKRLVETGIVEAGKEGREAVYAVRDPGTIVRLLSCYRSSLLDRLVDSFLDGIEAMR